MDALTIVKSLLTVDLGKNTAKLVLKKIDESLNIKESIKSHISLVQNWSDEVNFSDLRKAKKTNSVYVKLDTFLTPLNQRFDLNDEIKKVPLLELLINENRHMLISGQPGSGKTTSIKYLCQKVIKKYEYTNIFPLLIRVRDLNKKFELKNVFESKEYNNILYKEIADILGLKYLKSILILINEIILKDEKVSDESLDKEFQKKIEKILNKLKPIILIDGLDEVYNRDIRHEIVKDIENLALTLDDAKIIITTRTGEIYFSLDRVDTYEIAPLNSKQIEEFAKKWLIDPTKINHFMNQIENSPFQDTTIKPLTLAHLCAIYEKSGKIPDKPKSVYRKIINLLLEEWDEQRLVKRKSRYSDFEIDRKSEFLANLSYELTVEFRRNIFEINDLKFVYNRIYENYDLLKNEVNEVACELESHTGLFIKSGYDFFEFAHKSIQEFLTAEYITKLPSFITNHKIIKSLPNELAIAVTLSSNPSQYFSELVLNKIYRYKINSSYISIFINRLYQEKIKFNKNPDVIIAFLSLYTKYFEIENLDSSGQLFLIPNDPNFMNFEKILAYVCKVNNTSFLNEYYIEIDKNKALDDPLLVFQKVRNTRANYPDFLYTRESFIK